MKIWEIYFVTKRGWVGFYLIAGYVRQVAMHFETAPNTKAENAERASGDVALSPLFLIFSFNSLFFNWSKAVYCTVWLPNQNLLFHHSTITYAMSSHQTWMEGFAVRRREMPRPSNDSLHVLSERDFQSPLDFPNSHVCIFEDAVSRGWSEKRNFISAVNRMNSKYHRKITTQNDLHPC